MGLPLFLAMNAREIAQVPIRMPIGWMACHFSPCSEGLTNFPLWIPPGSILIIDDFFPCQGHSALQVATQVKGAVSRLECKSVLLDFQRPPSQESLAIIAAIQDAVTCPVAVSHLYGQYTQGPVFLPPCPLYRPLEDHLSPWNGREIWLEISPCRQQICVTEKGTTFSDICNIVPSTEGFYDEHLRCHYIIQAEPAQVTFTLFDTDETMTLKLEHAHSLKVTQAIGLWQEFQTFPTG